MIPLAKSAFLNETETKRALSEFVLHAPRLSMDKKCAEFQAEFAKVQGQRHAILFNSGASANLALLQALKNLGRLKENDKVGFSALTWATNTMPIMQLGFEPVPIDCEPSTLNVMSTSLLKTLKTTKLKAFFITNALGLTGDLDAIRDICHQKNIILIEDSCECLGTKLKTGNAGNFGVASTFSFFVAHHMSTIEGGMVSTEDDDLSEMLIMVRANGWDRNLSPEQQQKWRAKYNVGGEFNAKYTFYDLGYNLRPTEITGFLGLSQLTFLEDNIKKRQKNYALWEKIIIANPELIALEHSHLLTFSSFALPVLCKTPELRDKYMKRFNAANVEIRPMIAGNIQNQPFYKKYVKSVYALPGTDFIDSCGFYCGNDPGFDSAELNIIGDCLSPDYSEK